MTLELSTRYSSICSLVVAKSDAPIVMCDLIGWLNRSPPHRRILRYGSHNFPFQIYDTKKNI